MLKFSANENYDHGLFIPIHRVLPESVLESAVFEAGVARDDYGIQLPVVILDDAKTPGVSEINYELVKKYQANSSVSKIIWVSKSNLDLILQHISQCLKIPIHLLSSGNLNYGTIFNTLFIVGRLLGVRTFHRRDSDVTVQGFNNKHDAPIVAELDNIRKKRQGVVTNVIGGNYLDEKGKSPDSSLRLDECMKTQRFIAAFMQCLPVDDIEVMVELKRLLFKLSPTEEKQNVSAAEALNSGYVDCGNVCFTEEIYSLIPSAPNDFLIGSDYHFFNVARILNLGLFSHERAVLHDKVEMRCDIEQKMNYWRNMYYFCDAEAFHFKAYGIFRRFCDAQEPEIDIMDTRFRELFIESLQMARSQISKSQRVDTLDKLTAALHETDDASYLKLAKDAARDGYESILVKGSQDLNDYIHLLQRWQDVLDYLPALAEGFSRG